MANKVCMLSVAHHVKDDRIYFKEALSLKNAGYNVSLLFVVPKDGYARDMSGNILNPEKKNYFILEGIEVYIIPKKETSLERYFQKFFKASYQKEFIKKALEIKADVYHCHEPDSLYLGNKICKINKNARLVLDAHESWKNMGPKLALIRNKMIPRLDYLIAANDLTRGYLTSLNYKLRSEVIFNSAVFSHKVADIHPDNGKFKIVHEGSLKFNRGIKTMLETAKILKEKGFDFEWSFLGYVPPREKQYIHKFISDNDLEKEIVIRGNFAYEELPEALKSYHLGIIASTAESNNYLAGPPNKLFNYVAAGYPLVSADLPESSKWIRRYKVGFVVNHYSPENFAELIIESSKKDVYSEMMGNIKNYQAEFLWEKQEKKLLKFYEEYLS